MQRFSPRYYQLAAKLEDMVTKYRKSYPSYESRELMKIIGENIEKAGALDEYVIEEANELKDIMRRFRNINKYVSIPYSITDDYRFYEYMRALFKIEGLEYNKTMNLTHEFNEIYKMCNPVKPEEVKEDDNG